MKYVETEWRKQNSLWGYLTAPTIDVGAVV